jgi:uncharacterized protein (TIGR03437 family)
VVVALWATAAAHAAGPGFSAVLGGSGQDYAAAVASDAQGNTYIAGLTYSPDFPVTSGAFQTRLAGNGSLANPDAIASDAFVAKLAPDGTVLWSTFLGGSADDYATGVGVDAAGNVLVTGWTRSSDFPLLNAADSAFNDGAGPNGWDAFVTKLDPTGSKLIYSTYLGGPNDDGAYGLAVDAGGNAYVTGSVGSAAGFTGLASSATGFGMFVTKLNPQGALVYSYFHPYGSFAAYGGASAIAVDSAGAAYVAGSASPYYPVSTTQTFGPLGSMEALVFKISPDGSQKIYEVTLGGSMDAYGMAIAVDRTGAAYVGGITTSVDFPLLRPLESNMGARPLWKSSDGGFTWAPLDNLPFAFLQTLVADPTSPGTLYAATSDAGIFKSLDGGVTWNKASQGIAAATQVLTIDPVHPQTLYAATGQGMTPGVVYKTVNGGSNWSEIDSSASSQALQVLVDAQNPDIIYLQWDSGTAKSTDGGVTWSNIVFPGTSTYYLALDPQATGHLFAFSAAVAGPGRFGIGGTPAMVWRSTDGGADWTQIPSVSPNAGVTVDTSTNPSTLYIGFSQRSTDGGVTWTSLPSSVASGSVGGVAVDPSGTLYAAPYNNDMYTSHDRGLTWTAIGSPVPPSTVSGLLPSVIATVPIGASETLYTVVNNPQTAGFVSKLSPDGSSLVFSTLLRGHSSFAPVNTYAAEPGALMAQNWIAGLALDPAGNVVVAGGTRAADFPVANPAQAANAGLADAFVTTISADGGTLRYSTYLGGSQDDSALAVTTDSAGNLIFAGQTWSRDFPVPGGVGVVSGYGKAFVVKLAPPAPPAIASVLNGASFQPGIEAGSWVTITGTGLANTNPGRTWTAGEIVDGNLPTALDGVSVTIDGVPAFVEYISPTQINVQAPSDAAAGAVSVVVSNNGAFSAPATARLQAAAPAFFVEPGTNFVSASRFPDYAAVGAPSAPAHPGDLLVLWGTGFGPTNPALVPGTVTIGAPALVATPTVTVGGMAVPVLSAVLTTGCAGLYQITIQLPATVPTGALAIQASAGGVQTPAGVTIFVGNP